MNYSNLSPVHIPCQYLNETNYSEYFKENIDPFKFFENITY